METAIYKRWQEFFVEHDILLTPAVAISPPPWSELYPREIDGNPARTYFHWLALTYAITVVGHPAICLPVGRDEAGMPFGIQIVGRRGGDEQVIAFAAALEATLAEDTSTGRPLPDVAKLASSLPLSTFPGFWIRLTGPGASEITRISLKNLYPPKSTGAVPTSWIYILVTSFREGYGTNSPGIAGHSSMCESCCRQRMYGAERDLPALCIPGCSISRCWSSSMTRRTYTIASFLEDSFTDGFIVVHGGRIILERYMNGLTESALHLSQSVSKSIVGLLAGILADRGVLDVDAEVTAYLPELGRTAYRGARIQHLLDMTSGVAFNEEISDPISDIAKL